MFATDEQKKKAIQIREAELAKTMNIDFAEFSITIKNIIEEVAKNVAANPVNPELMSPATTTKTVIRSSELATSLMMAMQTEHEAEPITANELTLAMTCFLGALLVSPNELGKALAMNTAFKTSKVAVDLAATAAGMQLALKAAGIDIEDPKKGN